MIQTYVTHLPFQILDEPGPPRNLTNGTITDTSISIKWEPPIFDGNSPITNYTVSYKLQNDASPPMVNVTNKTSINLIDLSAAKTYVIVVSAKNNHFAGSANQITLVTADGGTISQFSVNTFYLYTKMVITYVGIH